jgi:hypothetical protein
LFEIHIFFCAFVFVAELLKNFSQKLTLPFLPDIDIAYINIIIFLKAG